VANLTCPACGAPVEFKSAAPYAVCAHCQSLLIRRDVTLESVGRIAQVPEDLSPLQLYSGGTFDNRHFTLIGRIRKAWDEGSWSEWCALFDDQRMGWLAEAQGDLVMLFEQPASAFTQPPTPERWSKAKAGETVPLNGKRFTITDVKKVICLGAEGELAAGVSQGGQMISIDLHGPALELATIEVTPRAVHLFTGRYVEFAESRFTNLRTLPGWQP
jgi:hypothetical protein